jgi:drug/metabolite transporter (DMT)-like permease
MALDPGVVALVLLAALLHATWNALIKSGGDRLAAMALLTATSCLIGLAGLPFVPVPEAAAWPWLLMSVAVHQAYFATLILAYRTGDLSQVYPIARGTAPMLVAVGAWLLAGEVLTLAEAVGVVVLSLGIVSLSWRRGLRPHGEAQALLFALMTAVSIALYSLADGLGVRASGHAVGYILWLFFLQAPPFLAFVAWRRGRRLLEIAPRDLRNGLAGGAISMAAYGCVIWALGQGPMAHVVALRETSVILAALLGTLFLGEPFGRRRIAAACTVAAGAALLQLTG